MLGSKSTYFFKSESDLQSCRIDMVAYLQIWKYSNEKIEVYLRAFDYFCNNPTHYDGETFVKDLYHIPELSITAMLHDYHCIHYNTSANYYTKWYADWLYAKENERLGKAQMSWLYFALLKIIGTIHLGISIYKRGIITKKQKENILKDYNVLIK